MLSMRFSWHPAKAESNLRKHGISFETAASAFADPFALSVHDRLEGGEQRWQPLGLADGHLLLLVAPTVAEDSDDGEYGDVIHHISDRKPARKKTPRNEEERRCNRPLPAPSGQLLTLHPGPDTRTRYP